MTPIRGTAPLYKAVIPSSFKIMLNAFPMDLYFSLPPAICNLVFMTSDGVTAPN